MHQKLGHSLETIFRYFRYNVMGLKFIIYFRRNVVWDVVAIFTLFCNKNFILFSMKLSLWWEMPLNACLKSNAISAHICNMKVVAKRAPSTNFDVKNWKKTFGYKTWKTFAGTEIEFFIIWTTCNFRPSD